MKKIKTKEQKYVWGGQNKNSYGAVLYNFNTNSNLINSLIIN
jgi:hypothetical protein